MTHFLFLEKGAQQRDPQRASREKSSRARRQEDAAAAPAFVFLVLPGPDGYRVLRAALEDVAEIPASELGRHTGAPGDALLERLLGGSQGELQVASESGRSPRVWTSIGRPNRERFGDVEIDVPARVVTRQGKVISLAPMEFDLLLALARRDGAAAARRDLLREVWGTTKAISLRTVDTHVSNLRRKIEWDAANPAHILTVKKVGYRLQR
jgi:hypothetical protein